MTFFADEHDFKKFPELTNRDLGIFGFASPHEQIIADFEATIVEVIDADTLRLKTDFRDFEFTIRLTGIDAPELNTEDGKEAKEYLQRIAEGEFCWVKIDPNNRVGKYGRLVGDVMVMGMSLSDTMMRMGFAKPFDQRHEGMIPDLNKIMRVNQWH